VNIGASNLRLYPENGKLTPTSWVASSTPHGPTLKGPIISNVKWPAGRIWPWRLDDGKDGVDPTLN